MARFLYRIHRFADIERSRTLLALVWASGLMAPVLAFSENNDVLSVLIIEAVTSPLRAWPLLRNMLIPLLLSAFAAVFFGILPLYVFCFCKAFAYGTSVFGVFSAFASSGWLIRWLFLFSATVGNFLALFFWFGCVQHPGRVLWCRLALCAAFMLLSVFLDCHFVTPMLRLSLV